MYVPPIWPNGYILWYSVTFIWLRWIPIHQITSNLGFSIPFHLYIHDCDLEEASVTLTCGVFRYIPLIWPDVYILSYSVTFIWLRRIRIQQITSNLAFSIPFHLYIHDQDLYYMKHSVHLPLGQACMYPRYGHTAFSLVFGYLYLSRTDTNPSTNSKSWS